jgi:hypothetical protein
MPSTTLTTTDAAQATLPDGWLAPVEPGRRGPSGRALRWLSRRALASFDEACRDPIAAQRRALARVLDSAVGTAFARDHGLGAGLELEGYRRAVPIRTGEAFAPWLERAARGETLALTRHPIASFVQTSGTAAARRLLPVTAPWAAEVGRAQAVWLAAMLDEQPELAVPGGRALASVGRRVEGVTIGGLPFGSNTGRMRAAQPWWVRIRYAAPAWIAELPDPELRTYVALRLALAVDVRSWTTASPSTVLAACRAMARHREALEADLVDGTLARGPAAGLAPADRRRLRPWVWRRRRLPADWRPAAFWPNLAAVNCWKGGQAAFFVERLPAALGATVPVREVGISASEGHLAVPLHSSWDGGVLCADGHLVELLPEGGGPPVLAHEVEVGGTYRVVLSTTAGLYRYDLGDLVRVVGRWRRAPLLTFVARVGQTSSMTGEKLTGEQVVQAARAAVGPGAVGFALAALAGDPACYALALEGAATADLASLADRFDRELASRNVEYASKRATDRLGPVSAVALPTGAFDRWRAQRAADGVAEGQVKEPIFIDAEALAALRRPLGG